MMALVERARGYEVALVVSDNPDAPGLAWAAARGIPTFAMSPRQEGKVAMERMFLSEFLKYDVQVVALAGYMRLISPWLLNAFRGTFANIHPSLLPTYKGLDTHARALAAGDAEAGCSVHLVTEELDAGAVLGQARVAVMPDDTPETLAARVLAAEHALYPRILAEFVMAPIDRVRDLTSKLPGTEERASAFLVGGEPFVDLRGPTLRLRERHGWGEMALTDDVDWQLVEDRIAEAWELAAPQGLLEAGGR